MRGTRAKLIRKKLFQDWPKIKMWARMNRETLMPFKNIFRQMKRAYYRKEGIYAK